MKRLLTLLGLFLITGLAACTAVAEPTPTNTDDVDIYTAVIRQLVTVDDTFGGTLNPPVVYLVNQTDDSIGDPDIEQQASQTIDAATQQAIVDGLADLGKEWIWVDSRDDVPLNPDNGFVEGEGVIITLGNILPQEDGSVYVSGSIYIAMLAAGGQTYILQQVDGTWQITGTTGIQWMS